MSKTRFRASMHTAAAAKPQRGHILFVDEGFQFVPKHSPDDAIVPSRVVREADLPNGQAVLMATVDPSSAPVELRLQSRSADRLMAMLLRQPAPPPPSVWSRLPGLHFIWALPVVAMLLFWLTGGNVTVLVVFVLIGGGELAVHLVRWAGTPGLEDKPAMLLLFIIVASSFATFMAYFAVVNGKAAADLDGPTAVTAVARVIEVDRIDQRRSPDEYEYDLEFRATDGLYYTSQFRREEQIRVGQRVRVRYLPSHPATVEPEGSNQHRDWAIGTGTFSIVAGVARIALAYEQKPPRLA